MDPSRGGLNRSSICQAQQPRLSNPRAEGSYTLRMLDDVPEDSNPLMNTFMTVYIEGGWGRHLPPSAILVLTPLAISSPLTLDELEAGLRRTNSEAAAGWRSPVWEPLTLWTDASLAESRAAHENTPLAATPEDPQTAAELMAEEAAHRAARITAMDAYSTALGVAPVRTLGDLLDFMVACGLVLRQEAGGDEYYSINASARLPTEVLQMSASDREEEERLRWHLLHEPTAQEIISLFQPDSDTPIDVMQTSLQRLARKLSADVESARAGLAVLLEGPDFTASVTAETAPEHQVFEIRVDWAVFQKTRISIVADHGPDSTHAGAVES